MSQSNSKIEIQNGEYFYSVSNLGAGSERYGNCEVCQQPAETVYHQSEYRLVELSLNSKSYQGLTMKRCINLNGHSACLASKRRGNDDEKVLPMGSIKSILEKDNLNLMKAEILIDMGYIDDNTTVVAAHA